MRYRSLPFIVWLAVGGCRDRADAPQTQRTQPALKRTFRDLVGCYAIRGTDGLRVGNLRPAIYLDSAPARLDSSLARNSAWHQILLPGDTTSKYATPFDEWSLDATEGTLRLAMSYGLGATSITLSTVAGPPFRGTGVSYSDAANEPTIHYGVILLVPETCEAARRGP